MNTSRQKKDGSKADKSQERKLLWDEENRLLALDDNGFVSRYWYDAGGERVIKESGDGEGIYVNNVFSGGRTETGNFTAYINPYLVVSPGGSYTKHIYIGNQRIVSKLGDLDSYGADPRRIPYAGADVEGSSVDYKGKYTASIQNIKDAYKAFDVPYYGKDNDDYVNGQGFCCNNTKSALKAGAIGTGNDNPELYQYYYHSDHLGSSSLITNLDGETVQHIEYVPFGEVFIEERNNVWNTPYKFNAKELDEETGLYYYGARYYDPRISLWYGVDPLANYNPFEKENYIDGQHHGGVYNSFNHAVYSYCYQNPIHYTDPNGKQTSFIKRNVILTVDLYQGFSPTFFPEYANDIRINNRIKKAAQNQNSDNNALYIYAHGYKYTEKNILHAFFNYATDEEVLERDRTHKRFSVINGATFNDFIVNTAKFQDWSRFSKKENNAVVLMSCRGGREDGIAQRLSKDIKNLFFVGATEVVCFNENGYIGTAANNMTKHGEWNVYKNGEIIGSFEWNWQPNYNDIIKKYEEYKKSH